MLKKKQEVKYRKGNRTARCLYCTWFEPEFNCVGIGGVGLGKQPRCKEIGLKPGRMYRVSSDHVCNAFKDRFAALSTATA